MFELCRLANSNRRLPDTKALSNIIGNSMDVDGLVESRAFIDETQHQKINETLDIKRVDLTRDDKDAMARATGQLDEVTALFDTASLEPGNYKEPCKGLHYKSSIFLLESYN